MIERRRNRPYVGFAIIGIGAVVYAASGCDAHGVFPHWASDDAPKAPPEGQGEAKTEGGGARPAPENPHANPHFYPPHEAYVACKGKQPGDACTAMVRDGEVSGKCETAASQANEFGPACRPEGEWRMHAEHRGPPPEKVFAACDGKSAGDACTVDHEGQMMQGACIMPKHGGAGNERFACAPARPHHPEHSEMRDGGEGM